MVCGPKSMVDLVCKVDSVGGVQLPKTAYLRSKVCRMMVFWAGLNRFGLFFYILLGFR